MTPKKTIEDYIQLAKLKNISFVGLLPLRAKDKTDWICENGHNWKSSFVNIKQNINCPTCTKCKRLDQHDYENIYSEFGYKIKNTIPKNSMETIEWLCPNKHTWVTSYDKIKNLNRKCPYCNLKNNVFNGKKCSKIQKELFKLVGDFLNYKIDKYYADIVLEKEKIVIEYDSWYWHKDKKDNDEKRINIFINLGWKCLSIKSNSFLPTKKQINEAIEKLKYKNYCELILEDWRGYEVN